MYEQYYKKYSNEVYDILANYLFWRMIQNRASSEDDLLQALNKTPLSWVFIRHALQTTLFIVLSRVFDGGNDAFSVDDLLKSCIEEIDIFSLHNLRKRKVASNKGKELDWLQEYIENAYEPTMEDFNRLRGEVSKRRNIFNKVYRPIRHKLIAHSDKKFINKADELWAETNIQELEGIIWFLDDLRLTLFETYQNGRKPILMGRKPDLHFYEKDYSKLLNFVKKI